MNVRRVALAGLGVAAIVGMSTQAADAGTWYSKAHPLHVYNDSGVNSGSAYGNFYNYANTYARQYARYKDNYNNKTSVYVETTWSVYKYGCDSRGENCVSKFWPQYTYQSSHSQQTTWHDWGRNVSLDPNGTKYRGGTKICQDLRLAPDDCSGTTYPSFNY